MRQYCSPITKDYCIWWSGIWQWKWSYQKTFNLSVNQTINFANLIKKCMSLHLCKICTAHKIANTCNIFGRLSQIVHSYLFLTATEHAHNTQTHRLHWESGWPVISEYWKTNVTIAVHMWMNWDVRTNKYNLKWNVRQYSDGPLSSSYWGPNCLTVA